MHTKKAVLLAVFAVLTSASAAMAQSWGREHAPRDGVCFYKDTNFHGDYFCVASGGELNRVPEDMNDANPHPDGIAVAPIAKAA